MIIFRLVLIAILIASGCGILTSNIGAATRVQQCPNANFCKCDGVNIICDCYGHFQDLIIPKLELTSASDFRIKNCNNVSFKTEAVRYLTNLRYITIENVKNLRLESKSLIWCGLIHDCLPEHYYMQAEHPSLDITIRNTTVEIIEEHAFSERIRNILFEKVTVKNLKAYAFNNLKSTKKIEVKGSIFYNIESQAFKKFYVETLSIAESSFQTVPSRMFTDINAVDFSITNSNFSTIKPQGFLVATKNFELIKSTFGEVESESFKVTVKDRALIKNNVIFRVHPNAFYGISTSNDLRLTQPKLNFLNNTVTHFQKDSFSINRTSFIPKFENVILNLTCTCSEINLWVSNSGHIEELYCMVSKYNSLNLNTFNLKSCSVRSANWLIITLAVVGVVFCLVVSVAGFALYKRHVKQQDIQNKNKGSGKLGLIVPDGRTYKETELHVIVEKAELLTTEL